MYMFLSFLNCYDVSDIAKAALRVKLKIALYSVSNVYKVMMTDPL